MCEAFSDRVSGKEKESPRVGRVLLVEGPGPPKAHPGVPFFSQRLNLSSRVCTIVGTNGRRDCISPRVSGPEKAESQLWVGWDFMGGVGREGLRLGAGWCKRSRGQSPLFLGPTGAAVDRTEVGGRAAQT